MCDFENFDSTEIFSLLIDIVGLFVQVLDLLEVSYMESINVVGFIGCYGGKTTTEAMLVNIALYQIEN